MKCLKTSRECEGNWGYRCGRCNNFWFGKAPNCFPPVKAGHQEKLQEMVAKVQHTIDEGMDLNEVDNIYSLHKDDYEYTRRHGVR